MNKPIILTRNLTIGYRRKKNIFPVQRDLNLNIYRGELVCLIGPNGCGKSTLLRTLAGLQSQLNGEIFIEDELFEKQTLKEKARLLALVLTDKIEVNNLTVYDLVSMGRNPYTDWLGNLTSEDQNKIEEALTQVHLKGYNNRPLAELSDGERQRAMIAKALVQDTPIIFLDEPTAHLDLPNRVAIMKLLHTLARETNKAIILSTHELDLALQTSDKLWLMSNEGIKVGIPEDLILNNSIQSVFANQSFYFDVHTGNFVMNHLENEKKIALNSSSNGIYKLWTERALKRNGYSLVEDNDLEIFIDESLKIWRIKYKMKVIEVNSIEKLLKEIIN